jgi:aminoglycoside phosphotransferase (APT) family kinase protein
METPQVLAFLEAKYGEVRDLEPLSGGFWSRAFGFRTGDRDLVLRVGEMVEGFRADETAMAYRPGLPVPRVLEIGEGLGSWYAVSARHYGGFLGDVRPEQSAIAEPMLKGLLQALKAVPQERTGGWHESLLWQLGDHPERHTYGWRARLGEHEDVFVAAEQRIRELLPSCPDRGDLVHGDLLHQNVLINEDASDVTAIFSWKCSQRGDWLYDVAWCTFWSPWYPGIAVIDLSDLVAGEPDGALRQHCYELHIGATHLAWYIWNEMPDELARVADELRRRLDQPAR